MSNTGDRKHGKVTFKLLRKLPRLLARTPRGSDRQGLETSG